MTPGEISEKIVEYAEEYSTLSDKLGMVLSGKPTLWMELRDKHKSDTACEREWAGTILGLEETRLRLRLKSLDKTMSALKTRLRVLEGEARNLY